MTDPVVTPGTKPIVAPGAQGNNALLAQYNAGVASATQSYQPTYTNTTNVQKTSQPDVAAMVNSAMMSLLGRAATSAEIKQYGIELLKAEAANPGSFSGETTYATTGKRGNVTGQTTSVGVDPSAFINHLIAGRSDATAYRIAGTYMDVIQQGLDKNRSSYNV